MNFCTFCIICVLKIFSMETIMRVLLGIQKYKFWEASMQEYLPKTIQVLLLFV